MSTFTETRRVVVLPGHVEAWTLQLSRSLQQAVAARLQRRADRALADAARREVLEHRDEALATVVGAQGLRF